MVEGKQNYLGDSMVLETRWDLRAGTLVLQDAMLWPESERPPDRTAVRAIVRVLRCERRAPWAAKWTCKPAAISRSGRRRQPSTAPISLCRGMKPRFASGQIVHPVRMTRACAWSLS